MTTSTTELIITGRMQDRITAWEAASDPRAVFLSCYQFMTGNVLTAIETGEFHDAAWVGNLLRRFAEYYFDALDEYDADASAAPAVWRLAHDEALRHRTAVLQKMLLGINAHINYDLVFALADLLAPEWDQLTASQREERFTDHCHVNAIIGRTIDAVQDQVVERYSPSMDLLDKLLGPLDEMIASRLIADWRDDVWDKAVRYIELVGQDERADLRLQVEVTTLQRANFILLRRRAGTP